MGRDLQEVSDEVMNNITGKSKVNWDKITSSQKRREKKHQVLNSIKHEYLRRARMEDESSRKREFVEMRAALMNSLRYVCTEGEVANVMWGRHRTTAYHAYRNHDVYMTSPLYRILFSLAVSVVKEYEGTLRTYPRTGYKTNQGVQLMLQDIKILQTELTAKLKELKGYLEDGTFYGVDPWFIQGVQGAISNSSKVTSEL